MEPYHRFFRAIGFGGAAVLGFHFAGLTAGASISIGVIIAALFILNVWTHLGALFSAVAIVWGGLVAANLVPGFSAVTVLEKKVIAATNQTRTDVAMAGPEEGGATSPPSKKALAQQLADLKQACSDGLLSDKECSAARAKIIGEFGR